MAARLLFQETSPEGTLPVSVPGIGYDLITAMSPEPNQVIPLFFSSPSNLIPTADPMQPDITALPTYELGNTIEVRTGVIHDYNNNPVPDGTVVRFVVSYQKDINSSQQIESNTLDGIANASIRIQNTGIVEIRASSDPALISDVLQMEVPVPLGAEATIVVLNTPQPTETPSPTITPTVELSTEIPEKNSNSQKSFPNALNWFSMILIVSIISGSFFLFFRNKLPLRWVVRWILFGIIGGNISYIIVLFQINSQKEIFLEYRSVDILALSVIGILFGWFVTWIWYNRNSANHSRG
jgi:beta-N-acetylhexosaminidase